MTNKGRTKVNKSYTKVNKGLIVVVQSLYSVPVSGCYKSIILQYEVTIM